LAQFLKQPRVLNRDHRLVGETPHEIKFARLEGAYLAASDDHHADRLALPR